jgi:hypothetical protein
MGGVTKVWPDDAEFARRGDEVYARDVRPLVEPRENGKFVAIDVESGAFEADADELAAVDRLLARRPGAPVWLTRVGSRYAHRFGAARV